MCVCVCVCVCVHNSHMVIICHWMLPLYHSHGHVLNIHTDASGLSHKEDSVHHHKHTHTDTHTNMTPKPTHHTHSDMGT